MHSGSIFLAERPNAYSLRFNIRRFTTSSSARIAPSRKPNVKKCGFDGVRRL
ncbi:hypothetical protein RISK_006526 [Rhodopirellula islandica]|uniref:Uncharacterized protein n=1 Tax=Rhodopirellula islandica TaxID=595434 RepID=A0A0J1B3A6_RHOIS|nr:hypothetical protein RISK_006526 [Rhodopirellula islandica]